MPGQLEKKAELPYSSGNPAISSKKRSVAFRHQLTLGLALTEPIFIGLLLNKIFYVKIIFKF
jgi:hypothetical protein